MELNKLFWVAFIVLVAVAFCGMGYCRCINKKRSQDGADEP